MAVESKANKPRCTPLLTRNGKTKLKPLNLKQLTDLLAKSNRPKDKAKIQRRILLIESRIA